MYLKANYNEINNVSKYVLSEAEKLDKTLKEMLVLIDQIKECWSGPDSDNFVNNSSTYIKNIDVNVNELKNMAFFVEKVSLAYSSKDSEWKEKIKKVGVEDEK